MAVDVLFQDGLFEKHKNGQRTRLSQILDGERFYLYDFILRMSGDQSRSLYVVEEVCSSILASKTEWETLAQFRLSLYSQARLLTKKVWNADVSKLEHPSIVHVLDNPRAESRQLERALAFNKLNQAISRFSGRQREVVLLHLRSRFTFSEIASLMGQEREYVETNFKEAILNLREQISKLPADPRKAIGRLPVHPYPVLNETEVTDLSGLIEGFNRERPVDFETVLFYGIVFFIIGALFCFFAVLLLKPELQEVVFDGLRKRVRFLTRLLFR